MCFAPRNVTRSISFPCLRVKDCLGKLVWIHLLDNCPLLPLWRQRTSAYSPYISPPSLHWPLIINQTKYPETLHLAVSPLSGNIFDAMGSLDLWLALMGNIDFWIRRQICNYQNKDPAFTDICASPISLLIHLQLIYYKGRDSQRSIINLILFALFLQLHPGE